MVRHCNFSLALFHSAAHLTAFDREINTAQRIHLRLAREAGLGQRLRRKVATIDAQLGDGLFARDPAKAAALSKARAEAAQALARAEEDWLAASAEYEDAM